jgi:YgiT-type zinc finger domain-containing protein
MKTLTINKLNKELTKKRNEPNYKLVNGLVYYVHKYLCNHELPIDLSFMDNFKNLKIETYSWFAKLNKISISDVIEITNSDSGCCWYLTSKKQYIILYNDLIDNPCHNRWTLAHELGHYLLKHNEVSDKSILGRNSLTEKEYKIYEKEANAFARELLAPLNVICTILNNISILDIMNLCNLSYEASNHIFNYIINGMQMGIYYDCKSRTTKIFEKFINNQKYSNFCNNCNHSFSSLNAKFCPICGSNNLIKGDVKEKVKYKSDYTLDENSRAITCPVCHNEEITDGEYCKICGTYLINKCTNVIEDAWGNQIDGCGKLAESNARYCIYCGSETTFYKNNLLCDYKNYDIDQENLNLLWNDTINEIKSSGKIVLYTNLSNSCIELVNATSITIIIPNITNFGKVTLLREENINEIKNFINKNFGKGFSLNIYDKGQKAYVYEEDVLPF